MFWTIVAPELVLGWSLRQWYAARKIANIYNARNRELDLPFVVLKEVEENIFSKRKNKKRPTENGLRLLES